MNHSDANMSFFQRAYRIHGAELTTQKTSLRLEDAKSTSGQSKEQKLVNGVMLITALYFNLLFLF